MEEVYFYKREFEVFRHCCLLCYHSFFFTMKMQRKFGDFMCQWLDSSCLWTVWKLFGSNMETIHWNYQTSTENTTNESQYCDDSYVLEDYTQRIIISVVLCIVILVGTIGNSLVILSVFFCRKLRSSTNWFVVNLAIADLLTCLFLPFNVVAMLSKDGWPIAHWTCTMTAAVTLTCPGASIMTLALIAFNRWYLLTKSRDSFYRLYTKRNISLMVLLSWMYPFLLVILPPLCSLGKLGYSCNYKVCQQDTTIENSEYYSLIAGVCVIIPVFIVILVIYILIYIFVRDHNKVLQKSTVRNSMEISSAWTDKHDYRLNTGMSYKPDGDASPVEQGSTPASEKPDQGTNSDPKVSEEVNGNQEVAPASDNFHGINTDGDSSQSRTEEGNTTSNKDTSSGEVANIESVDTTSKSKSVRIEEPNAMDSPGKSVVKTSRHHINVTKRLSIVVLAFFICYVPFGVCVMVPKSDPAIPWTNLLVTINSCMNPIIYAWTMPIFREVMGLIVRCRIRDIPEPVGFIRTLKNRQWNYEFLKDGFVCILTKVTHMFYRFSRSFLNIGSNLSLLTSVSS